MQILHGSFSFLPIRVPLWFRYHKNSFLIARPPLRNTASSSLSQVNSYKIHCVNHCLRSFHKLRFDTTIKDEQRFISLECAAVGGANVFEFVVRAHLSKRSLMTRFAESEASGRISRGRRLDFLRSGSKHLKQAYL